eukprot:83141-Chlamydomonas_euryale.AAC.1
MHLGKGRDMTGYKVCQTVWLRACHCRSWLEGEGKAGKRAWEGGLGGGEGTPRFALSLGLRWASQR